MASISINSTDLAANTRTGNIISGDPNEFVGYDAHVSVFQVSSASGIRSTILADTDVVVDDKEILGIGTTLDTSAHLISDFDIAEGTRLSVFLRNTTATATYDVLTLINIDPL
jgi:hypothetical protein